MVGQDKTASGMYEGGNPAGILFNIPEMRII